MAREQGPKKPGVIYISPSQVATFRDCPRKWAYRYIDKIKSPPKPEQQFGIEGHERNEKYLGPEREWVGEDDVGKTCQQGIKKGYLPTPADDLLIEQKIEIPIFNGKAMMIGYVDCVKPPRSKGKGDDKLPIVHDWKFTKDLRWAMKAAELDGDPQAAVYAKAAFMVYEDAQAVIDRWVYFCGRTNKQSEDGRPRTPRGVRRVQQKYTREQVEAMWDEVMKTARQIIQTKQEHTEAKTVKQNELHCDAYGGCPHRDTICRPGSPGLGARMEQYDKTHKKKTLTQSANGDNDGNPTSDGETTMSAEDLLAQLRARGEANEAKAGKKPDPKPEPETKTEPAAETKTEPAAEAGDDFLSRMQAQAGAGDAVNPPADTPATESPEAGDADPNPDDLLASLMGKGAGKKDAPKAEAPAEMKPDPKPESDAKTEPATEPDKAPKKKKGGTRRKGSAFIVAIDVAMMKGDGALGDVVHLSEFLQPITDYIAKEYKSDSKGNKYPDGIGHWGLIPFGEGKAYLARQVEKYLDTHGFKGVLLVDGSTPEGAAVKDALVRRADVVLKGVR